MQVRLTTNLGSRDAEYLGVTLTEAGSVVAVSDQNGDILLKRGWAEYLEEDVEDPAEDDETEIILNAVPPEDLQAIPPKRRGGRRRKNAD